MSVSKAMQEHIAVEQLSSQLHNIGSALYKTQTTRCKNKLQSSTGPIMARFILRWA